MFKYAKAPTEVFTQIHLKDIIDITIEKDPIFKIEKSLKVNATYYFRFYTVNHNLELLDALHANSYEVGYHFEEIATYAKQNYIKNRESLIGKLDEIRNIFIENFHKFKAHYAPQMNSICSHGDWINVRLDLPNHTLVTEELLNKLQLNFEAYHNTYRESRFQTRCVHICCPARAVTFTDRLL